MEEKFNYFHIRFNGSARNTKNTLCNAPSKKRCSKKSRINLFLKRFRFLNSACLSYILEKDTLENYYCYRSMKL